MPFSVQDSSRATVSSGPLSNGSCGYGQRQLQQWPFLNVTAISANSSLAKGLPKLSCGICIQVTCTDEVRPLVLTVYMYPVTLLHALLLAPDCSCMCCMGGGIVICHFPVFPGTMAAMPDQESLLSCSV